MQGRSVRRYPAACDPVCPDKLSVIDEAVSGVPGHIGRGMRFLVKQV
jgi:hypothetical protein